MNWAKAKNVIIIIFFVLNIFLLVNLFQLKFSSGVSSQTLINAKAALGKREITVQCDIPGYTIDNVMLNYEANDTVKYEMTKAFLGSGDIPKGLQKNKSYEIENGKIEISNDGAIIIYSLKKNNPIKVQNEEDIKDYFFKTLRNTGIPIKNYVIDEFNKSNGGELRVKLIEKYKDFLIYDNHICLDINKEGQSRIEFDYKKVLGLKKNKSADVKVKPAYQILLSNYSKGKVKAIQAIDVGFKCSSSDDNSKFIQQRPVWRVKTDNNKVDYYHVYTGEKLN